MVESSNCVRRRGRLTTIALAAVLVGGVAGIDGVASHLAGDRATARRSTPVSASSARTDGRADLTSATDVS